MAVQQGFSLVQLVPLIQQFDAEDSCHCFGIRPWAQQVGRNTGRAGEQLIGCGKVAGTFFDQPKNKVRIGNAKNRLRVSVMIARRQTGLLR
jgi:hypothetical protein